MNDNEPGMDAAGQITWSRPRAIDVAEDAGKRLADLSIDELWKRRESLEGEIKSLQGQKGAIDLELWERAKTNNPAVEKAGAAVLAGDEILVEVGANREWSWNAQELVALQAAKDAEGRPLLTPEEYAKLVDWEPKVNGRFYNGLLRRGGFLAEALERCRTLKSARPRFDAKGR